MSDTPLRRAASRGALERLSDALPLWCFSLRTRLVVAAWAAILLAVGLASWQFLAGAERATLRKALASETREAERTASQLAERLTHRQRMLRLTGARMHRSLVADPARAGAYLMDRPLIRALFSDTFLTDGEGRSVVAVQDRELTFPTVRIDDREYFQAMLAQGQGVVSKPLQSRVNGQPILVFVQPLIDADGLWGVLGGTLNLDAIELGPLLSARSAEGDDLLTVVTDAQGRIVAHPDPARLLQPLTHEPRLAMAAAAWEAGGFAEGWAADGLSVPQELVAVSPPNDHGLRVWRVTSLDGYLDGLRTATRHVLATSVVAAIVVSMLLLPVITSQMRSLQTLERRAADVLENRVSSDDRDWPQGRDEVARFARTLRHVLAERVQLERFSRDVLGKLSSVMAASPVGLVFTRNRRFELVSAEFCRLLGRTEGELLGQHASLIYASEADYLKLGPLVAAAIMRGEAYSGEWQMRRADGSLFWARLKGRAVDPGQPDAGTIWNVYDITDQVRSRAALEHDALHDPLTQLLNRKAFQAAAARLVEAEPRLASASLIAIDLDHFKPVNDSAGHAGGDAMLQAVAASIRSQVRGTDTVARLGGDEFAVLLPGCDGAAALTVAEKIRKAIAETTVAFGGRSLRVGASLGVAPLLPAHRTVAEWFAAADQQCYAAKHAGRGGVRLSEPMAL